MFYIINMFDDGKIAVLDSKNNYCEFTDEKTIEKLSHLIEIKGYKNGKFYNWYDKEMSKVKLLNDERLRKELSAIDDIYNVQDVGTVKTYAVLVYYKELSNIAMRHDVFSISHMEYLTSGVATEGSSLFVYVNMMVDMNLIRFTGNNYKTCNFMFERCQSKVIRLPVLDTSNVTSMVSMFESTQNLRELEIKFDTSKVVDMSLMFRRTGYNKVLDLKFMRSDKLEKVNNMFEASKVKGVIFNDDFTCEHVLNLDSMFCSCKNLRSINLSMLRSKLYSLRFTFRRCNKLKYVNLSNISIFKYTKLDATFEGCSELVILDVRNLKIINDDFCTNNKVAIFKGCSSLKEIIINKESYDKIYNDSKNVSDDAFEATWGLGRQEMASILNIVA